MPAASLDGTASLLRAGGLAACPTETYFAVACDARNACAVDRVYQAKGRLATKPLPLVCADKDMVLAVTDLDLGAGKEQLHPAFFAFWPGPLTLVLKARAGFFNPKLVDARGKIALRVTPHPAARALAQTLGGPITATSANLNAVPVPPGVLISNKLWKESSPQNRAVFSTRLCQKRQTPVSPSD